ncbi:MAG TPA: hypothetical protein VFJ51_03290 [Nitrososphaeraceae archaeon]|nr:hypothetical protein [Nitrososphaeraceae archaeon]
MKRDNMAICIFSLILIIAPSLGLMTKSINYFSVIHFAYGQSNQIISSGNNNNTNTNSLAVQDIPAKKVHVGGIDIAYKIFGKGKPLMLIAGSGASMDMWDPQVVL